MRATLVKYFSSGAGTAMIYALLRWGPDLFREPTRSVLHGSADLLLELGLITLGLGMLAVACRPLLPGVFALWILAVFGRCMAEFTDALRQPGMPYNELEATGAHWAAEAVLGMLVVGSTVMLIAENLVLPGHDAPLSQVLARRRNAARDSMATE